MYPLFEHALLGDLLGEESVSTAFSGEKLLGHFCQIEIALADALASSDLLGSESAEAIIQGCRSFVPNIQQIREDTLTDGLSVPAYVRQLKTHIGEPYQSYVHVGATSQDLIDTALALTLKDVITNYHRDINLLQVSLQDLNHAHGQRQLMGRTRMQAALPITIGDRIATWLAPLARHRKRLAMIGPAICVLQMGGAVGTNHVFGDKAAAIANDMASALELGKPSKQWHTQRDTLVDFSNWLSLVTGTLGKMGQDICLMAQQGVDDVTLTGGGSSSAMPHKQNPISAETLVTLARYNAVQVSAMHIALVHEQERSGSAWALEWMILPKMCEATACALKTAIRLTGQVSAMGSGN